MQLYLHAGRIPEGYRKDTGRDEKKTNPDTGLNCTSHIYIYIYGLESAQLIPSVLKKLETFQLKVLRKILKIDTTYINRVNSNSSVFNRINTMMEEEGKSKRVISFVEAYNKTKRKEQSK